MRMKFFCFHIWIDQYEEEWKKVVSDYKFIFESQWNENRDREEVKFDVCGETSTVFCRFNRI